MKASFYSNQTKPSFLDKLKDSLSSCSSFSWSVSFIKKAGLSLFLEQLEEALRRGVKGKIVTSTYQNFTDVPSLRCFLQLQEKYPNFECRLENKSFGDDGFHTKGYLFSYEDGSYECLIGSSNITYFALLKNKEWDLGVTGYEQKGIKEEIEKEFAFFWDVLPPLSEELIKAYEKQLEYAIASWDMDYLLISKDGELNPNYMQRQALKELQRYRNLGQEKAMVIAATGSGKTFLSAFDARNFAAKKLLFLVHKDTILTQAMKTFSSVFKSSRTYGLYTGSRQELDADFLFASNQMLSRHLSLFDPSQFDYIVIDEVHHAAASTYKSIIDYFKPRFLLGLTATPDRMDGQDVYDMFGNNVPFDLRLREALENHLVVPFHYYGIKDSMISYGEEATQEGMRLLIQKISSTLHCSFIRQQIEAHRPSGKLRCVGFCKSVEHARLLALNMRGEGYHTAYLTGASSLGERVKIFEKLEDEDDPLELVFAVDILNEGIDVPSINMVLFLRPTDSSTIFIQQLGRGLRKYKDKKHLIVLDFIANSYKRSSQIAFALGSLAKGGSGSKAAIASMVKNNFKSIAIPDLEIHFDEESQEEILSSIEATNFNSLSFLKQDYANFKAYLKLGPNSYPQHKDFLDQESGIDLLRFTQKFASYYDFLSKIGEDVPFFSPEQRKLIASIYELLPLTRPDEYLILSSLLNGVKDGTTLFVEARNFKNVTNEAFKHALSSLQDEFYYTKTNEHVQLVKKTGEGYSLTLLPEEGPFKEWVASLLEYGLRRYQMEFGESKELLKLYYPYTSVSSLRTLQSGNFFRMSGIVNVKGERVLYIDLQKEDQSQEHLKYKDTFLSPSLLQWESQTQTSLDNNKGKDLIKNPACLVFVRKSKREDGAERPFYYVGKGRLTNPRDSLNPKKALLFDIVLEHPVPSLYFDEFGIEEDE